MKLQVTQVKIVLLFIKKKAPLDLGDLIFLTPFPGWVPLHL